MSAIGLLEEVILRRVPKFLRGANLGRFLKSYALTLDGNVEQLRQGLTFANPLTCPREMLTTIAKDRGIRIYPTEPEASQRARLADWLDLHRARGSHRGEMLHAQPYFLGADGKGVLPRMRIVHQSGDGTYATWHTLSGSYDTGGAGQYTVHQKTPSNWDFDGHWAYWSRYWAIIYTPGTILDTYTHWDDGSTWNGGQCWDGSPSAVFADLTAMFADWKAAHSQLAGVILATDLTSFDPTASPVVSPEGWTSLPATQTTSVSWGALVDPGTNLPTRLPTASFIFDRYFTNL